MSSLVERLRVRTERKPLYNYEELDDDLDFVAAGSGFGEIKPERIIRTDSKDGLCQACGQSGTVLSCDTCSYAFHPKCLLPPLKVVPVCSWSCPECVSPLNEIDKILDCEMRPTGADESEASKLGSKQKFVKQYLVKWKGLSHLHCTWVPEKEFLKAFKANPRLKTKVNNFHRQMDSMNTSADEWIAIRPEWTTVDRIIAARAGDDEREYLVKWKDLPYDESCWEVESDISAFQPKIERFKEIQSKARKSFKHKSSNREGRGKYREFQQYDHSPDFLSGGSLHPYQLEGLNFLRFSWSKHAHVILADEMGLGKTIQSIAYLASLYEENLRPHLVVAPLSTLRNWEREFALWAPHMNVVMYVGSAQARAVVKKYEFFAPSAKAKKLKRLGSFKKEKKRIKFDVLLTSYEMINMDSASLKPIKWECMIVDEGHRLKNKDSKLFLSLKDYFTNHRVLLTGTPLQNNLDELFMLMHFLDAGKFASLEEFQEEFKDINQEEQIVRLHKMLAPHLLRRVKKDVMKELPPKKELILRVELSNLQKEYYRAILTRNYQILTRKGGAQISLNNVVMELRKLCCHAYMLEGVEPDIKDASEAFRQLLESSGKLQLLDKLMVKLKEQGHRVLIYTQFQHMLDLLEDYLSYMKWNYERIDGSVSGVERQVRIDRFNAKNSSRFCFLLSTRAGGLGINLATADTVVIYDSDWNPHADLQAMARAHRLGQTNKVMIFRLITRGTIEERMMEMTKKKMILEHLVVGKMKNQMLNQEELDDIIRYGSKELFADESDEAGKARQIHYDDAAIDRLLDREQITNEEASHEDDEEDGFFKAFKVANFEYIDEVEAAAAAEAEAQKQSPVNKLNATNTERASYWEDLLRDRYDVNQVEEASSLGKRRRNKKQVASAEEDNLAGLDDISSDDEEADWIDTEVISSGNAGRRTHISRKRGRADNGEPIPLIEGEGKSFKVLGFNNQQRAQFLQLLMRFGFGNYDWSDFVPRMKQKIPEEINDYGFLLMNHLMEEINDQPCFSDGVPKEGLRIIDVHVRNATMSLIREKVELLAEKPEMPIFEEDIVCRYPALRGGRVWKKEHDKALLLGVLRHGYGRWQSILEDKEFGFQDLVRVEQKLASANDSATQNHEGGNSRPVPDGSAAGHMYQEYCSKDAQRKLVEYIKKRVYLLEKGLNAEYAKIYFAEHEANEHPREEPILVTKHPDAPHPDAPHPGPMEINCKTNDHLPALEAITPTEVSAAASDCKFDRMEIARLYNEMGKLIADNTEDSIDAYKGNEYAAVRLRKNISLLEGIYGDVHQLLSVQQQMFSNLDENYVNRKVQSEVVTNATEAGSLSNNTKTKPDLQAPTISSDPSSDPKDQLAEKVIVLDD